MESSTAPSPSPVSARESRPGRALRAARGAGAAALRLPAAGARLVFNPIVVKELQVASRLRRQYVLRFLYVGLIVTVLGMTATIILEESAGGPYASGGSGGDAARIQTQQNMGSRLSVALGWAQLIAIMLIGPILTSATISDEVEDRTLDVLLITPFTTGQILMGKLMSRFINVLVLLALGIPVLVGLRYYGGFELRRLLEVETLCITTAILCLAAGLVASAWSNAASRSIMLAFVLLLGVWILLPLGLAGVGAEISERFAPTGAIWSTDFLQWFAILCLHLFPPVALSYITIDSATGWAPVTPTTVWTIMNAVNLTIALVFILAAAPAIRRRTRLIAGDGPGGRPWRLRMLLRPGRPDAAGPPQARESIEQVELTPDDSNVQSAQQATVNTAAPPARRPPPRKPIEQRIGERPVLWRELRLKLLETRLQRIIAAIAVVLLAIWFYIQAEPWRDEVWHVLPIFLGFSVHLLLATLYSAIAITQERQTQNWETLLCTPLRARQIVWPKFVGILWRTSAPSFIVVAHLLAFAIAGQIPAVLILHYALIAWSFAVFCCAVGMAASLVCKRGRSAMVAALAVLIFLWAGLPFSIAIIGEIFRIFMEVELFLDAAALINPFVWMTMAAEPAVTNWAGVNSSGYEIWMLYDISVDVVTFTGCVLITAAAVIAAAAAIIALGVAQFNRLAGRGS